MSHNKYKTMNATDSWVDLLNVRKVLITPTSGFYGVTHQLSIMIGYKPTFSNKNVQRYSSRHDRL
jgi:hypothetical protein